MIHDPLTLRAGGRALAAGGLALAVLTAAAGVAQDLTAVGPDNREALAAPDTLRPRAREAGAVACTPDGASCIAMARYIPDVCRTIEAAAGRHGLDRDFFLRLIWRESLFDAGAVSPAGAEGIAQFMPGTAALRGLGDAFNPAEALEASAAYLAEMTARYGNIGLAAVGYNGGEARAEAFIAKAGGLPLETRAYVYAITGFSAEAWRDAPPAEVSLGLGTGSFQELCVKHAGTRGGGRGLAASAPVLPWGVIIASHRGPEGAERQVARLKNRFAGVIGTEEVAYVRSRMPGMARRLYNAQVGRDTRAEADALCGRLRAAGGDCMVLKN